MYSNTTITYFHIILLVHCHYMIEFIKLHFHYRCKQWAVLCRRDDLLDVDPIFCNRHYKLCSRHFDESQFIQTRLIPNAVPSKFEWNACLDEHQEIAGILL